MDEDGKTAIDKAEREVGVFDALIDCYDFTFVSVSEKMLSITGNNREDMIGKSIFKLSSESPTVLQKMAMGILGGGELMVPVETKDGTPRPTPMRIHSVWVGSHAYFVCTIIQPR